MASLVIACPMPKTCLIRSDQRALFVIVTQVFLDQNVHGQTR